ncbi:MAG: GAF domain-containing protein [Chloroflexi bacterium]|nr:GAF domain-containing protein [Chloroflexota bacterium]
MNDQIKILLVEDNPGDARLIQVALAESNGTAQFDLNWADRLSKAAEVLATGKVDVILVDLTLPDSQGLSTVTQIIAKAPEIPIIILTGLDDEALAVNALQEGAQDYLVKGQLDTHSLIRTIRYGIERKQAERALRLSEARKAAILEGALDCIITIDHFGRILEFNPAAQAVFGYTRAEVLGKEMANLIIPPSFREQHRRGLERYLATGEAHILGKRIELTAMRADGSEFPIELAITQIEGGEEPIFTGFLRDITDRKKTAEAEREQRTLAEALRDTAEALNSTLDLEELLGRILENVGRVVPHDAANIMLIESGAAHIVRSQGYTELGFSNPPARLPLGVSQGAIFSRMVETGQALVIPDTHMGETWIPIENMGWIRSFVGTPIRSRDQVIGFINLDSASPNFFTPVHAKNLQAFANQAGSAFENAHLLDEIRQRLKELEAVNRISTAMRVAQTLDEILPRFLEETLASLNSSAGSIWLYDPDSDEVHLVRQIGWDIEPEPVKSGETVVGYVVSSGRPYLSRDFKNDLMIPDSIRPDIPEGIGGACVPIRAANQIIGVVFVNVEQPREFSPEDLHLLATLVEIAGNAIHRTRLFEQTEQRLQRIASLHKIDTAITSSFDLQFILDILLTQVTTHLGVDAADILLLNPYMDDLEFAASRGFKSPLVKRPPIRIGDGLAGRAAYEKRMVTVANSSGSKELFLEPDLASKEGFTSYYGMPLISKGQVLGVLEVFNRKPLKPVPDWLDFLITLAGQAAIAIDSVTLFNDLQHSNIELTLAYDATIEGWSHALDLRDKETEGHTQRVTQLTLELARSIGLKEEELVHIRRGALLHDIGKMGIPDYILLKPDKLTDEEWRIMRQHPTFAYEMLAPIAFLRPALDIPYYHHEKWDGNGYPLGLKGEQIPLAARIFTVVDVWDALCSDRPYRSKWPKEKVVDYIREQSGTHFDPHIVEAFFKLMK